MRTCDAVGSNYKLNHVHLKINITNKHAMNSSTKLQYFRGGRYKYGWRMLCPQSMFAFEDRFHQVS